MLLRQLVGKFLHYCENQRARRTAEFYRDHLRKVVKKFGDLRAAELRPHHCLEFKLTWHLVLTVQRLYRWAVDEQELLPVNPMLKLRRPRLGARRRVLAPAELLRLLRCAAPDFRRFLLFARETGARPQEIRQLAWGDLRGQEGKTSLEASLRAGVAYFELLEYKGRARRTDQSAPRIIPVSPRLGRLLLRLQACRPRGGLILRTGNKQPWNKDSLRMRLRRLLLRTGLAGQVHGESICCYTLRHTSLTSFAAQGMQTSVVQQIAGHANIRTTQRYIHLQRAQIMDNWRDYWSRRPAPGEK